jgi:glycerol-3-phosphate dehydrogenase
MNRQQVIDHYHKNPQVSVLIIGAGVNGIGTFRDLALQGVDVLLVDRSDFCSGASAASSHMIHGGIRYLENGEFRLVKEAVRERNLLMKNAPHYVKPLPTIIPIFHMFSGLLNAPLKFMGLLDKPSERGAIVIKIGLMLYDAYTGRNRVVPKHQFFSQDHTQKLFPAINPEVEYTAKYFDGLLLAPERLCVDMLLDGERANINAHAMNYLPVIGSTENCVKLEDQLTGDSLEIEPKIVINASGPWIDFTNHKMGFESNFIGGTKGSHLIVDNPNLRSAIGENEFFFENADGRIVLLFPYEDKVLVGTSDLPIQDPDSARCTDEEIDYFINMVKIVFPEISIQHDQIVFQFSGVRPLPASDSSNAGQISRDHKIQIIPSGDRCNFPVFNLIGGKWTSFRAFSEEVTDNVIDELGLSRKSNTSDIAIGGGRGYPRNTNDSVRWVEQLASATGTSETRTQLLFSRYGTRAEEFFNSDPTKSEIQLSTLPQYSKEEILHIVRSEKVIHVDDLILRRSNIAKSGLLNGTIIAEIAEIIGTELMWSEDQLDSEIKRTYEILEDFHGVLL